MVSTEQQKAQIQELVSYFRADYEKIKHFSEPDIETKLIEPLFYALGWTKHDFEKRPPARRGDKRGIADYAFKIDDRIVFYLEAKKVGIPLEKEADKQVVSYALSKRIPFAVSTNFEELKIFCVEQENALSQTFWVFKKPEDYISDFQTLLFLSKDSFENNRILQKAEDQGRLKKRMSIDKPLLEDLMQVRKLIVEDIGKNYPKYELNDKEEIVQRIIDRLIFIRRAEDVGINPENLVLETITHLPHDESYPELKKFFHKYNEVYNSGLFAVAADNDCDEIKINGAIIKTLIEYLYESKDKQYIYNFDWIDADVLGQVYEQYLGKILSQTKSGKTKLKEGQAHRKEQGIYYTPTYIVDYIVKNTLLEILKNKKINQKDIKVLDLSSGSGSFLIKAFDYLYASFSQKDDSKQYKLDGQGAYSIKTDILKKNSYGVDLDNKAVEITKLNLLLKAAEKNRKLPEEIDLHIKHGDSLVDDDKATFTYPFKWEGDFKVGSFDVVIGNPPYFNIRTNLDLQEFCRARYPEIYTGQNDVLYYFILKGLEMLNEGGLLGLIVARYFLESDSAKKIREFILKNSEIVEIIDFGNNQVFDGANVLTAIIILRKNKSPSKNNKLKITKFKNKQNPKLLVEPNNKSLEVIKLEQKSLSSDIWTFSNAGFSEISRKIEKNSTRLGEIAKTGAGIQSGLNEVYVVDTETIKKFKLEDSLLRNYAKTRDIKPYLLINRNLKVIRLTNDDKIEDYPNTKKYLLEHQDKLKNRYEAKKGICLWYAFSVPRNLDIFDSKKEKIITPIYSTSNKFGYDSGKQTENYLTLSDTAVIQIKDKTVSTKAILAILNSNLMEFYYKQNRKLKRAGYYEYLSKTLETLPIKCPEQFQKSIEPIVDKMLSLNKRLNDIGDKNTTETKDLKDKIESVGNGINQEVYRLYGLTEKEIEVIESL